ncbi:MAG TPA: hypothetical protein VF070_14300 [Streptosporangiaceae bacterium]
MDHASLRANVLTANGRDLAGAGTADGHRRALADIYKKLRFVQIEDFVAGDLLAGIMRDLMPEIRRYTVRIVRPHEVSTGSLREGRRFGRIDPTPFEGGDAGPEGRAAIQAAFDASGLTGYVSALLAESLPLVEAIAGRKLRYDRTFLLTYGEADFIAPHGDTQTSRRVMLQMPVSTGCRTAIRVMRDGWMEPYYDNLGAFRVHGPGIWHEVPPVLRLDDDVEPERVLVTVRLPFADDE